MTSRVQIRVVSIIALVLMLTASTSVMADSESVEEHLTVFDKNSALQVVIPDNAHRLIANVAEDFARILSESSGHAVGVSDEGNHSGDHAIYIGNTSRGNLLLASIGNTLPRRDSFIVSSVDGRLVVLGTDHYATAFGVYSILGDYLGARWFRPGTVGEYVPTTDTLTIPEMTSIFSPSFFSRQLSGLHADSREEVRMWRLRNRLRSHFPSSHNLAWPVTAENYENHPEWFLQFASIEDLPTDPKAVQKTWQPPLSDPAFIALVAERAIEFFDENPNRIAYSVGINDNIAFPKSVYDRETHDRWFRRRPDISNEVFAFTNQVAEKVAEKHPDKYIIQLAYYWAENVPDFPVHPNVVPFLTADRSQYYDRDFAREDKALMQAWGQNGPDFFAVYDYYYGNPYVIPRIHLTYIAESIPAAYDAGARVFYAELYPNWDIDAVKAWLAAQLLWNVGKDPHRLLNEFFDKHDDADANDVEKYFAEWERVWISQSGEARWLKYYNDPVAQGFMVDRDSRRSSSFNSDAAYWKYQAIAQAWSDLSRENPQASLGLDLQQTLEKFTSLQAFSEAPAVLKSALLTLYWKLALVQPKPPELDTLRDKAIAEKNRLVAKVLHTADLRGQGVEFLGGEFSEATWKLNAIPTENARLEIVNGRLEVSAQLRCQAAIVFSLPRQRHDLLVTGVSANGELAHSANVRLLTKVFDATGAEIFRTPADRLFALSAEPDASELNHVPLKTDTLTTFAEIPKNATHAAMVIHFQGFERDDAIALFDPFAVAYPQANPAD